MGTDAIPSAVLPATKVRRPRLPQRFMLRDRLIDAVDDAVERPLTVVAAPAGAGKSTVLAAWHRKRAVDDVAWLSIDVDDNDPRRMVQGLVGALQVVAPDVGGRALSPASASGQGPRDIALPSLVNEVATREATLTLIVDDYHLITNQDVHDSMGFLVTNLPENLRLVVAGRHDPPLPLARLRLQGELSEIREDDLALDEDEATTLLRDGFGLELPPSAVAALHRRTEGWTAGMCLAGLWLSEQPTAVGRVDEFATADDNLLEYLGSEILTNLPTELRSFLLRTSILDRLEPALCDAVRGASDAAEMLEELDRRNLFVVPLDRGRRTYRYHHLFREWLLVQLAATAGDEVAGLHRRAAEWHQQAGDATLALGHLTGAGDPEQVVELLEERLWPVVFSGAWNDVVRLIDSLPQGIVDENAGLALMRAWASVLAREPAGSAEWRRRALAAHEARPDDHDALLLAAEAHAMNVASCLFRADAAACADHWAHLDGLLGRIDRSRVPAGWPGILAEEARTPLFDPHLAAGTLAEVRETLDATIEAAETSQAAVLLVPYLLGIRAILAVEEGDAEGGLAGARRAVDVADRHPRFPPGELVLALCLIAEYGPVEEASRAVERMSRIVRPTADDAFFFGCYLTARAAFACRAGDIGDAADAVEEAESVVAAAPDPVWLRSRLHAARERVAEARSAADRTEDYGKALTDRELSILRAYEGNLTQREIGRELYLSFNTVKTYSRSIFRKLGVSSREDAVTAGKALGII